MKTKKPKLLQAAGWKTGTAAEFLGLSESEAALVELKLALVDAVRRTRQKHGMSQIDLAQRMQSSQSRIAKIEAGGSLLGGIGVSGAPGGREDEMCAAAGIAAIREDIEF